MLTVPTPSAGPARPVRVLQFGTGRFLLGFVGDFLDRANRQGGYDGHAMVVQSTDGGQADAIEEQRGAYTLIVRGADGDDPEPRLIDAYAGAVRAGADWARLLTLARGPELAVVISNTAQAGFGDDPADTHAEPRSFAARLTALLLERWAAGGGGLVVLPCELIDANGAALAAAVRRVAAAWGSPPAFATWLDDACTFANTLVDRIVTGRPSPADRDAIERRLGYRDALITIAEPYALWAIEGDRAVADRIGFAAANPAIVVTPDITLHRELKLRLLNGGHSAGAALALLLGHVTVSDAMRDRRFASFVEALLRREIGSTLDAPADLIARYIDELLARWRNPRLDHRWADIAIGYRDKLRTRLTRSIGRATRAHGPPPELMAIAVAAILTWLREPSHRRIAGLATAADASWDAGEPNVAMLLARTDLWGEDISAHGFAGAVTRCMEAARGNGFAPLLDRGQAREPG